jgi:hypothetical protein
VHRVRGLQRTPNAPYFCARPMKCMEGTCGRLSCNRERCLRLAQAKPLVAPMCTKLILVSLLDLCHAGYQREDVRHEEHHEKSTGGTGGTGLGTGRSPALPKKLQNHADPRVSLIHKSTYCTPKHDRRSRAASFPVNALESAGLGGWELSWWCAR